MLNFIYTGVDIYILKMNPPAQYENSLLRKFNLYRRGIIYPVAILALSCVGSSHIVAAASIPAAHRAVFIGLACAYGLIGAAVASAFAMMADMRYVNGKPEQFDD